ncbi:MULTISPECIES: LLM class F420-dependent oxidoreductase [Rhodococcus]|uniref:LLM class F420-dependent oxidoreductase n=1 Tax=Rhodococcus TaxID=1827 RepID=UPI00155AEE98|nr:MULTISPECIES: LLM class F420-dependent oxidoreductase [Rhodococcus]QQZ16674.1 LLM class F420-dependent oxidoreductase [Rhodococcus sp. 21391]
MKVGIRIPGAGPWAGPEAITEVSRFAEKIGFDSLWMTDHVALPTRVETAYPYTDDGKFLWDPATPYLDCLTSLTWAAAATERIELGTSCLILPWRPLVQTAKTLVSIDVMSRGRLSVAIGVGWMKEQFELLGAPFKDRGRRTTEMVNAMRHMWKEDEVDFDGEFYQLHDFKMYPKPVRGTIPVWFAGYSTASLRRIAAIGDGWHPLAIGPEEYAGYLATLRQYAEEAGRDMNEITLTARPLRKAPYNAETIEAYGELGVTHFICDTSFEHDTLEATMDELAELADAVLPTAHNLA